MQVLGTWPPQEVPGSQGLKVSNGYPVEIDDF